ncbi:outer-membrane receptor for ferric coprogen and ferric-rhodotorulic acid [Sphingomonas sp. OV641]|uniref:TonB-dependent siderophore receptor n=1 Tax=Sphingomonas sp. OV641 TaxID=1881068 RepID=UPI0008CF6DA0|nr:TonB-dependent siderophore receptor [Sphingomonas sp. OV641]SEI71628.1 outer-membrane receptor for ferric coprogen and ferric-rhodotorulic acid [Sphingomonas sp. OV641]
MFNRPTAIGLRGLALSSLMMTTVLGAGMVIAGPAAAQASRSYDIPAGSLSSVLGRFIQASGVAVVYDASLTQGVSSAGLRGSYGPAEALSRILSGSGLTYRQTGAGSFTIERAPQTTDNEVRLDAVRVEGAGDAGLMASTSSDPGQTEDTGSYATNAVTIGKSTRSIRETPQSVSVITRARLDDQNLRTMDDALLNAPGIVAEQQSSFERNFFSRGFEITTIQYDGVPTERNSGFFSSPDLASYDRVEVLRGPAGLFNGAGQPGATINLVRKRPQKERHLHLQGRVGNWDYKRVDGDTSVPLNASGSIRSRFVASYEDREFFYDYADSTKAVLYGIVEADLGPNTTLGVGINYEQLDAIPFYTGILRYANGTDLNLPRSTYTNGSWSTLNVDTTTFFADLTHHFGENWKLKLGGTKMRENNTGFSGAACCSIALTTTPASTTTGATFSAFDQTLIGDQWAFDGSLTGSFEAFGQSHDLLIGGNYMNRDYDNDGQAYSGPAYNPFTYNPYTFNFVPSVPARAASSTTNNLEQWGLYGSLRLALTDRAKLLFGGRFSSWKTRTQNNVTGLVTSQYRQKGRFTPYVAATYDVLSNWTAYASYVQIFRSQSNLFTAEGEPLDPATGGNAEAGLKGELFDQRVNATIAVFHTIEKGRSQIDVENPSPCSGSPTLGNCYIQDGKVRSQGVDVELTGMLTPNWQIAAGYTYNVTKYLRDRAANGTPTINERQPLSTFTPKHMLRLWTSYQLPGAASALTVAGGVNFQTAMYKRTATIFVEQPTYSVWSGRVSYQISPELKASANFNNIFDQTYYRTIGTTSGNWYGEPRSAMLSLEARF